MDNYNWGPADPMGKPYMEENEPDVEANKHDLEKTDDWRAHLSPISRHRVVNKIMETLKRHLPVYGQEGLQELKKIAVRFEEKIYSAATNQTDYRQKITLKMLTVETKSQHTLPKTFPSNVVGNSNKPTDPGASHNQVQSLPIQLSAHQSQGHQPDMEANEPDMETNKHDPEKTDDWRAQLPPASRHRIVNKIMETLKRHLPVYGQEGLQELKKIAVRFEEKIYSAATNQTDYLQKLTLKMLTVETKFQHTLPKTFPSNVVGNSNKPTDPGASHNQVQSLPIQLSAHQSQGHQPMPSQNIGNSEVSAGVQSNVTDLQQQLQQHLLGTQFRSLSLQTNQPSVHVLQQSEIPLQSESYGNIGNFLRNQEHLSHPLPPQQKMMSKTQSVPEQLQQRQSNQLLQILQASGQAPPSFLQPQDLIKSAKSAISI